MNETESRINALDQKMEKHIYLSESMLEEMSKKMKIMEENHLTHIQDSMQTFAEKITIATINIEWLMKTYWIVVTSAVGGFIASLIKLFF